MIVFREYTCPVCGFTAWAMDNLKVVNCHKCGAEVKTTEIDPNEDHLKRGLEKVNSS